MHIVAPEYSKIETFYNRDKKTFKVIAGDYRLPEFEYLKDVPWYATEKIDGTNVRIGWCCDGQLFRKSPFTRLIAGRTSKAQVHPALYELLASTFTIERLADVFPSGHVTLYGEGYGPGIRKGGAYRDNISFILFDVRIDHWWLRRENLVEIAEKFRIDLAPIVIRECEPDMICATVCLGNLKSMIAAKNGKDTLAEGVVLQPTVQLFSRTGNRILAKIKRKDFPV